MKTFKQFISEEGGAGVGAPTNATGTAVVGTGDDSSTVPVRKKKKRKPTPIGRYRTRVAWKESFSVKDSKKLQKAAVLSTSDDPKDQDRARARRTEIDFKDLQRQIRARKRLKEGSSIIYVGKRNKHHGPTGDHRRDKEGNIVASHYKKKPSPTGEKYGDKSNRPKTPKPADVRKRTKKGETTRSALNRAKKYEREKVRVYSGDAKRKAAKTGEYSKGYNEESLDKPVQSMFARIKSAAKKY